MKSRLFKLNGRDFFKGLLVAVVTALLSGIYNIIQSGGEITVKSVIIPGVLAMISYLLKNLFTNSSDEMLTPDNPETPKVI
jgi:hypothetical protein